MIARRFLAALLAALIAVPGIGAAQERPATQTLSSMAEEERAQILVLASSHLGGVAGVTPAHFDPVIERLKAFAPQIIAIERVAGDEVMLMQASPHFASALDLYVGEYQALMTQGQAASGLDAAEARAAMGSWRGPVADLTEGEKLDRLMIGLAAYELETALLYFRALGGPEREEWPSAWAARTRAPRLPPNSSRWLRDKVYSVACNPENAPLPAMFSASKAISGLGRSRAWSTRARAASASARGPIRRGFSGGSSALSTMPARASAASSVRSSRSCAATVVA